MIQVMLKKNLLVTHELIRVKSAFQIQKELWIDFLKNCPLQTGLGNDKILFVIDGMRPHLYNPTTLMKANGSYFDLMRKYFIKVAVNNGYEVIDTQPIFINKHKSEGIRFEFPSDGHWNEAGHILVAEEIKTSAVYGALFEK